MFSVIREDARSAMASLSYAADRLRATNRYLWMFPQGTLVHQDLPVVAEPGIGILAAKLGSVRIVPVAMRYELLRSQHPVCWIRVGEPLYVTPGSATTVRAVLDDVSNAMNTCASILRSDAHAEQTSDYRMFLSGRRSMDAAFDAVTRAAHRVKLLQGHDSKNLPIGRAHVLREDERGRRLRAGHE